METCFCGSLWSTIEIVSKLQVHMASGSCHLVNAQQCFGKSQIYAAARSHIKTSRKKDIFLWYVVALTKVNRTCHCANTLSRWHYFAQHSFALTQLCIRQHHANVTLHNEWAVLAITLSHNPPSHLHIYTHYTPSHKLKHHRANTSTLWQRDCAMV